MRHWRTVAIGAGFVLAASGAASSAEFFVGRWAPNQMVCTGSAENITLRPLVVTEYSLHRSAESCRIGKMYKTAQAVFIEAHCSAEGKMRTIPIRLEHRGE